MRIIVTIPCDPEQEKLLRKAAPDGEFFFLDEEDKLDRELLGSAEVIIGNVDPGRLGEAGKLRWLQLNAAGVGAFVKPGVLPETVQLTNASGAYGLAIAEHMLGMLLAIQKKLLLYRDQQRQAVWIDLGPVRAIEGSHTLVIGMGDIGGSFARRMHALGGTVSGIRRHPADLPEGVREVRTLEYLDELLPEADVIACALPSTSLTRGLINASRFARMKPSAILLNVGRGDAIVSADLLDALREGRLAGAGLDVTDPEPLPPDHPLWQMPNVLITPHISGGYNLRETVNRIIAISSDNLRRFKQGLPLRNEVDRAAGYRRYIGADPAGSFR